MPSEAAAVLRPRSGRPDRSIVRILDIRDGSRCSTARTPGSRARSRESPTRSRTSSWRRSVDARRPRRARGDVRVPRQARRRRWRRPLRFHLGRAIPRALGAAALAALRRPRGRVAHASLPAHSSPAAIVRRERPDDRDELRATAAPLPYSLALGLAGVAVYALERGDREMMGLVARRLVDRAERTTGGVRWRTLPQHLRGTDFSDGHTTNSLGLVHGGPGAIAALAVLANALSEGTATDATRRSDPRGCGRAPSGTVERHARRGARLPLHRARRARVAARLPARPARRHAPVTRRRREPAAVDVPGRVVHRRAWHRRRAPRHQRRDPRRRRARPR